MPVTEQPLVTWDEIAKYMGCTKNTIQRRKQELLASGVLMYRLVSNGGHGKAKRVWTWPSLLQRWAIERGKL